MGAGTAVAQAISLVFTPLITRLYGPDAYGLMGIFMTIVTLLSTASALGYPSSIVLPKNDADALLIARLSIYTAIVIGVLTTFLIYFIGYELLDLLNASSISQFMYLIPIAAFIWVLSDVLRQWLIRKNAFALIAKFGVINTLLISIGKVGFGALHPSAMLLIVMNVAGGLVGTALTYLGWIKHKGWELEIWDAGSDKNMIKLAIKYKDFPLFRTPQNIINMISHSLPVLLLASYFGPGSAGQYALANSVLSLPNILIGSSIMSVFYPRVSEAIYNGEDARSLIIKATTGMAVIGALPYLVVIFTGPRLFDFVFGEEWNTAGKYAQWLSIWLFFQYINKPAVSAIPALRLQRGLLIYEIFSTGSKIVGLWIGFALYKDDVAAVAIFSILGVVAYLWLILWVIRYSRKGAIA